MLRLNNNYCLSYLVAILVGFEKNFSRVDEDVGSFELCIMIFTDVSLLPTSFEFFLSLSSIPGTAGSSLNKYNIFS